MRGSCVKAWEEGGLGRDMALHIKANIWEVLRVTYWLSKSANCSNRIFKSVGFASN
jgi:hypothetical protein